MPTDADRGVDYRIRPAKHSERKLFCEALGRLNRIEAIGNFRYVGMGSIYFVDFILVHRLFGIDQMTSIEHGDEDTVARCHFNRPYDCIDIVEDSVASALPELLAEQTPTIMWLDYDEKLAPDRLEEVRLACASLALPSFVAVTVNVKPEEQGERIERFREVWGNRDYSRITDESDLSRLKYPLLMHEYIAGAIQTGISSHSGGARYRQVLHVRYGDGAEMLTVGGLLYNDDAAWDRCDFRSLPFFSEGEVPYELRVPKLTYRERKALDRLLPEGDLTQAPKGLKKSQIDGYRELYRHAPFYVDIEV